MVFHSYFLCTKHFYKYFKINKLNFGHLTKNAVLLYYSIESAFESFLLILPQGGCQLEPLALWWIREGARSYSSLASAVESLFHCSSSVCRGDDSGWLTAVSQQYLHLSSVCFSPVPYGTMAPKDDETDSEPEVNQAPAEGVSRPGMSIICHLLLVL